jgi:hypothetical protein
LLLSLLGIGALLLAEAAKLVSVGTSAGFGSDRAACVLGQFVYLPESCWLNGK